MQLPTKLITPVILLCFIVSLSAFYNRNTQLIPVPKQVAASPKIQAAILLDVSGSMSGLIEQAKAQLWTMVTTMGKVECENKIPAIEIALYEYGRPANGIEGGYVKQISPFTSDLDALSQQLFALKTGGGDEYCGQVIFTSLNDLGWDSTNASYKVIFIAGNEDFLQGKLHYTKACAAANQKGVIVNTIYCGDKARGIAEHWQLGGECGNGSYTNINHNAKIDDIPTPYDSMLMTLNDKLNDTYIGYGATGAAKGKRQKAVDELNSSVNKATALKRAKVKSNAKLYKNESWDLVDRFGLVSYSKDVHATITLPDSLKNKTPEEIQTLITNKSRERTALQQQMAALNLQRDRWLTAAKNKNTAASNQASTLETEVETIIRQQVQRFNMRVVD